MNSPLSSPKFGTQISTESRANSAPQNVTSQLRKVRRQRISSARFDRLPPNNATEIGAFSALDQDRSDISLSLSVRYMQLRDQVARDRKLLKSLREEFGMRQESLKALNEASKQEKTNDDRLQELHRALSAIVDTLTCHNIESSLLRHDVLKRELAKIATWNHHVASLLTFLEAQQLPFVKPPTVPMIRSGRSRSPIRHWSP